MKISTYTVLAVLGMECLLQRSTDLSVVMKRELVSGVCRLSDEPTMGDGRWRGRVGGGGGWEGEGGPLPPPVAIHYNCVCVCVIGR